ncbi:hypothetical protein GQX74_000610 [Glossina fuscipes]|nr:hypothetical protein GQX74_000610 [Glossina fuscipes]
MSPFSVSPTSLYNRLTFDDNLSTKMSAKSQLINRKTEYPPSPSFLMPAEFYKNLFATAVLHQKQHQQQQQNSHSHSHPHPHPHHHHHHHHHHHLHQHYQQQQQQQQYSNRNDSPEQHSTPHTTALSESSHFFNASTPVASNDSVVTHFPRNLLFTSSAAVAAAAAASAVAAVTESAAKYLHNTAEKIERKHAKKDDMATNSVKKPNNYLWSNNSNQPAIETESESNNNLSTTIGEATSLAISATSVAPPTPPAENHINLDITAKAYNSTLKSNLETDVIKLTQHTQQQQQEESSLKSKSLLNDSGCSSPTSNNNNNSDTMPISGVQGQNPTQGLVHWMSAVMAEHMTGQTHHDPTAVGMHYMWNGNVDDFVKPSDSDNANLQATYLNSNSAISVHITIILEYTMS